MPKLTIHIRLKHARKELKLNQTKIAEDLSIQQKTISEIENGKILNIPNTYIYYFYKKGISLDWLYAEKGPMMNKDKVQQDFQSNVKMDLDLPGISQIKQETDTNKTGKKENTSQDNNILYERLLEFKDFTINNLISFIKTQENNFEFFKAFIDKVENKR